MCEGNPLAKLLYGLSIRVLQALSARVFVHSSLCDKAMTAVLRVHKTMPDLLCMAATDFTSLLEATGPPGCISNCNARPLKCRSHAVCQGRMVI